MPEPAPASRAEQELGHEEQRAQEREQQHQRQADAEEEFRKQQDAARMAQAEMPSEEPEPSRADSVSVFQRLKGLLPGRHSPPRSQPTFRSFPRDYAE
jgi:hypothetical protein